MMHISLEKIHTEYSFIGGTKQWMKSNRSKIYNT